MATPAEIANDMAAHADYWQKRDRKTFETCNDAARVIRMFLGGQNVDGRTYYGLHRRLLDLTSRYSAGRVAGAPNFDRALRILHQLRAEATK
ncbi:hypothetical protein SAMN04488041_103160 [Sulfitobacter pontiacus]|uniref:Uncharacterized protein n=1 Tax=Sulfitobacter pontiacus TaxID=60137 RepID=A0A1H2W6S1_9RHOB|nr:hypothetical protein [Sulfitobacter pontiacus]SDW75974.1 hypothetical protein SAMN04488041_103160 [Sulfitobacter pontiacus]